jgi:hypothetical protein
MTRKNTEELSEKYFYIYKLITGMPKWTHEKVQLYQNIVLRNLYKYSRKDLIQGSCTSNVKNTRIKIPFVGWRYCCIKHDPQEVYNS